MTGFGYERGNGQVFGYKCVSFYLPRLNIQSYFGIIIRIFYRYTITINHNFIKLPYCEINLRRAVFFQYARNKFVHESNSEKCKTYLRNTQINDTNTL